MTVSRVLLDNMMNVNRQLLKISGVGITLLYGLSFVLWQQGYLDMPGADLAWAAASSYLLYICTCLLYLVLSMRRWFHYIFPVEMYLTVVIGFYFFQAPLAAYPAWLLPVIYAGMYALRGPMLVTALLVLVTAPIEAYLTNNGQATSLIQDVAIASIVMLVVTLRMVSLVNRSRAIIATTEREMDKSQTLQRENEHLMEEVAATAEEVGLVIGQLSEMAQGMRDALTQITQGGEEIISSSLDSKKVLLENQQVVEAQVERSAQIGDATRKAVDFAEQVGSRATAGEAVVSRMAEVMQEIEEQSRDTREKIGRLTERTREISVINDTIAEIAKNITVVAINASIEAARAGAAGRTFQIVAAQVQGLARQTAEAVEAIGELAGRIQQDLALVNENMAHSTEIVQTGVEVSADAREKLREIGLAVQHIHEQLFRIAADAGEQQSQAGIIADGIELLREKSEQNVMHIEAAASSTEETAAIMEEYVQSAERLRERADTLQKLIAQYGSIKT